MGLGERRDQGRRGHEEHRVAFADGFAAQGYGEVRLADAGRPEQKQSVTVSHPAADGQI